AQQGSVAASSASLYHSSRHRSSERKRARGRPRARPCYPSDSLEAISNASRSNQDVVEAVLAAASRHAPNSGGSVRTHAVAAPGRHRMLERIPGEEITAGDVERDAGSEPVRRRQVELGTEVPRIT